MAYNSGMRTASLIVLCVFLASMSSSSFSQKTAPPASQGETAAVKLQTETGSGLELWQTALGRLWIPIPGRDVIMHLQWEQTVEKVYHHPLVHVRPGDIVIDCGAHIGGFTRVALQAGARMVVAIEPEPANLRAFQRNLAGELKTGRVKLIPKGIWDSSGRLSLHLSSVGDSHSAVIPQNAGKDESIEVTTLDALMTSLNLARVDFIKMDIEGSERKALLGARQMIVKWQPRLAISSYHQKGDPAEICSIVWQARSDYLIASKDLLKSNSGSMVPKVLFFYR